MILLYIKPNSQDADIVNTENSFIIALRESKFLFKSNSKIYEAIKDINQTCSTIKYYHENGEQMNFYKHEEIVNKRLSIEEKLISLENKMLPYLRFDLLHKWYHCIL